MQIYKIFPIKKEIIVFLGYYGIGLYAFKNSKLHDDIYIKYHNNDIKKKYIEFLHKHPKKKVIFLIDNDDCELTHEKIPVVGLSIKSRPIRQFIDLHYSEDQLVAHNLYDITTKIGEILNVAIVSYRPTTLINDLLYSTIKLHRYGGFYFLLLELPQIIDNILINTNNEKYKDYFQVFVDIATNCQNIRIVVRYKRNVIAVSSIDYPHEKSDMYLLGLIEHAIVEKLSIYKDYIKRMNLKKCAIILSQHKLQKKIDIPLINIATQKKEEHYLLKVFSKNKNYKALGKQLGLFLRLTRLNKVLLISLISILTIGLIIIGLLKYSSVKSESNIQYLKKESEILLSEYDSYNKNFLSFALGRKENHSLLEDLSTIFAIKQKYGSTSLGIENVKWHLIEDTIFISLELRGKQTEIDSYYKYLKYSFATIDKDCNGLKSQYCIFNITIQND